MTYYICYNLSITISHLAYRGVHPLKRLMLRSRSWALPARIGNAMLSAAKNLRWRPRFSAVPRVARASLPILHG